MRVGNKRFNFIDTPGHSDYFSNAIKGASQIDIGVLIIDCLRYTSGLEGGNTKQLISLLKGNDVKTLLVCVNKMDEVDWREESFLEVKSILEVYFSSDKTMQLNRIYVPISAYKGENLIEKVNLPWVKNSWFLKELLAIDPGNDANLEKPLRMTVKNTFKSALNKKKGFVVTVKVESGIIKNHIGEKFLIMPRDLVVNVKNIFREEDKITFAKAGDTVDLVLQIAKEEDFESIERGHIITTTVYPIPLVQTLAK